MPDHKKIYQEEAGNYQRLVAREDYQDNLSAALREINPWENLDVVDLGAGTGRLAVMMAPLARSVVALDLSAHMLGVAAARLSEKTKNWLTAASDHRAIPLADNTADLIVSGWSFCYLAVWEEENWQASLQAGLNEVDRVLRPGRTTVIIETLSTGVEEPSRPEKLKEYFKYLESHGFKERWLRTDYRFEDKDEAEELTEFFFGEEMLSALQMKSAPILPECTGIWWK